MPGASKKISRLEKEAILRAKDSEYKREQSSYLFNDSYQDDEDFEKERHRRFTKIRQANQIQREIDHQVGLIDKIGERREQETFKKQTATTRSCLASLSLTSKSSSTASSLTTNSAAAATPKKYVYKTRPDANKPK